MFKFHKITVFFLLIALVISTVGCILEPVPRVTLSSASSTQTPCPVLTPFQATQSLGNSDPKLIYILIDQSPSYQEYVPQALDIASRVLASSVYFDDLIIASYITSEELQATGDLDKSIFLENQVQSPPSVPLTVTPHFQFQPSTPIPTITPYAAGDYTSTERRQWEKNATVIAVQNLNHRSQEKEQATCMHSNWAQKVNNQIRNWEIERNGLLEESKNDLQNQITMQKQLIDTQGSFYYESLNYVAEIIKVRNEQNKFEKSTVIIFSNLNEFRTTPPLQYQNSFDGVDIIIPILYCKQEFNCQENTEHIWEKILKDYYHPASVSFIYLQSQDYLIEKLVNNLLEN